MQAQQLTHMHSEREPITVSICHQFGVFLYFGYKRVYITEDKQHFELARFASLSDLHCHLNTAQFSRFKGQPPILGLAVHESTPEDPAVSLHKQHCLDMDPYMKEYFINCRIPYKLGRTTRWNWERSGNVLPLFFFSRVCNQGKLGLFPNLVPGPSQCEWRFISFAAHIELITSLMYSDSHPSVIKSHFDQLQGAHPTFHRSLSLM